jgi:hypothetical protein
MLVKALNPDIQPWRSATVPASRKSQREMGKLQL